MGKELTDRLFPDVTSRRDETLKVKDISPKQTPDLSSEQKKDLKAVSMWDRMNGYEEIGDNGETTYKRGTYADKESDYKNTRSVVEKDKNKSPIKWKSLTE